MKNSSGNQCSIGIYTGEGASHSWTWFAETFECAENVNMVFMEEDDIRAGALKKVDFFMIGGGDVYGMASGLGARGANEIDKFVKSGGVYIGSCAGAYLVMNEVNLPPYTPFKLINSDMGNYAETPPKPLKLLHKYKVPYGDGFVYNPVYGPVKVTLEGNKGGNGNRDVVAPLYGGPVINPGDGVEVMARYTALEKGCLALNEEENIKSALIGGCAAAVAGKGKGRVYIFGPHFECPAFPSGHQVIKRVLADNGIKISNRCLPLTAKGNSGAYHRDTEKNRKLLREIKGELSNARIVAFGLERMPVTWSVGTKVWEPEKLRYFIEFARARLDLLEKKLNNGESGNKVELLADAAAQTRVGIRNLKRETDAGRDATDIFTGLIRHLKHQTVLLLETIG